MLKNKLWVKCKLGEIAQLKNGYAFKSDEYKNEGIPIVRISDIKDSSVSIENSKFINQSLEFENYNIESGDILIAMSGATTGKFGIYNSTKKAYQNQRVGNLKPILESATDKNFLFYLLYSLKRKIEKDAYGGAQPNISSNKVEAIEIEYPPLNEQHRIVAKIEELFSELDQGIDNLKTAQAQLKVYRQALLKHAFEGKLTAEWRAQNADKLESASALQQRIQQARAQRYQQQLTEWEANGKQGTKPKAPKPITPLTAEELAALPALPEGWGWTKLGELCEKIFDGTHFSPKSFPEGKYKYITAKNIKEGRLDLTNITYLDEESHREIYSRCDVKLGDILYIKDGATTGIATVNRLEEEFSLLSSVAVFRFPKSLVNSAYAMYFFNSEVTRHRMLKEVAGVAITRLTLVKLNRAEFVLPSLVEQEQIVVELESKFSAIEQLDQTITTSLQQAEALRQSILKKAFSGELVPQDPNDEPAAALLARIKEEKQYSQTVKLARNK